jgi:hypothetical protein
MCYFGIFFLFSMRREEKNNCEQEKTGIARVKVKRNKFGSRPFVFFPPLISPVFVVEENNGQRVLLRCCARCGQQL